MYRISDMMIGLLGISAILLPNAIHAQETATVVPASTVYVSPEGSDAAQGTREAPLATVSSALEKLLDSGGEIVLRAGVYRESVTIAESMSEATLVIRAEAGETVVFDGGEPVSNWEKWEGNSSLYVTPLQDAEDHTLHVWDSQRRYRYFRNLDAEGVRAWPGSFCLLEDGRLLVNPHDGEQPTGLERSLERFGIYVMRNHVSIQGIHFRNYFFNNYTAAVVIGVSTGKIMRDVEIVDCRMENAAKGIRIGPTAEEIRILRCHIRDTGTGINNTGNFITIQDCVIENAMGDFQVHGMIGPLRCAIRLYHPGRGARVTGNVTAGFTYGLRIKSGENNVKNEDPEKGAFIIEHNTFLDGVSITGGSQSSTNRYACNIVGNTGMGMFDHLYGKSPMIEANYLIVGKEQKSETQLQGSNQSGPDPFVSLSEGNLNIRSGVTLPVCGDQKTVGSPLTQVEWGTELSAFLAGELAERESDAQEPLHRSPASRRTTDPQIIHVAEGADSAVADGSAEHPFAHLQEAFDLAAPGDTIQVAEGVYTEPAVLTRSGTESAPILIQGAGETRTLVDGGRRSDVLMELNGVRHVIIRDMQFRWFEVAGIAVRNSSQVSVEQCRFINAEMASGGAGAGAGVLLDRSPNCRIAYSIVTRTRFGFRILRSPGVTLENNTAFKNLNTGAELNRSCRNSVIVGNSFTFSGHSPIYMWEPDLSSFSTMVMDFNNYSNRLYDYRSNGEPVHPVIPAARYGRVSGGKGVLEILPREQDTGDGRTRFHRLEDWQQYAGLDTHSVFADPQYVDPLRGDFRVLPGSPNILGDGRVIGAMGVAEVP